jgi:hypothetical protein
MAAAAKPRTPALALSVEQACQALGIGWDLWREHVEPTVKIVRLGRRKLVAVSELERFLAEHGERVLADTTERDRGRRATRTRPQITTI